MKPDEQAFLIAVANEPEVEQLSSLLLGFGVHVIKTYSHSPRDIGARLGIHRKRVEYLCQKWTDRRWYEYGVSVDLGWLTEEGRVKAKQLETTAAPSPQPTPPAQRTPRSE